MQVYSILGKGTDIEINLLFLEDSLALADRLIKIKNGKNYMEYCREEFEELPDNVPWKSV